MFLRRSMPLDVLALELLRRVLQRNPV